MQFIYIYYGEYKYQLLRNIRKIPPKMFADIQKWIPFSSVDIIILKGKKIILTRRGIPPYRGYWHLPGSVILKNEKMVDTVKRSSKEELGIEVVKPVFIGTYETFTKIRHYITHLFIARYESGQIKLDFQSSEVITVDPNRIPIHMVPIQKLMVKDAFMKSKHACNSNLYI